MFLIRCHVMHCRWLKHGLELLKPHTDVRLPYRFSSDKRMEGVKPSQPVPYLTRKQRQEMKLQINESSKCHLHLEGTKRRKECKLE